MKNKTILWLALLCPLFTLPVHAEAEKTPSISKEDCYLCGNQSASSSEGYRVQNNVGLIDLNTFDVMPVEINRYGENGRLDEEPTGYIRLGMGQIGDTLVTAMTDVDRGCSNISFQLSNKGIVADAIGSFLCADCLDSFYDSCFGDAAPMEIAVINFSTREIHPLTSNLTWFSLDDYLIECWLHDAQEAMLHIIYRPVRYQK